MENKPQMPFMRLSKTYKNSKSERKRQKKKLVVTSALLWLFCFQIVLLPIGPLLTIASSPSSPPSQKAQHPNILFVIADDWGYGHASVYGSKFIRTPALDRVAREGVLFTRAFTPNAKCAPSRAVLLTGRNSWQLEEAANHTPYFPAKFKTWVEALGENGYFTGMTAKGWGPGVANDIEGKPRQMAGKPFNRRKLQPPATGIGTDDYAANFEDFLNASPKGQPWSFWYGALEPHRAYEYGSGVKKAGKSLSDIDRVPGFWPDNETVRNDMLDYAFEVEHFDRHLERMLAALERRGLLENTIVIVTSDHGMPFPRVKGQAYDASNHVPLAVMWKNGIKSAGRIVDDYVSFADLAPTLIELANLKWGQTGMQPAAGRTLTDILFSNKSGRIDPRRDHVLVGKERHDVGRPNDAGYPIRGIRKNDLLYLHNYEVDRWPAGNPETGYLNCDGGATKTAILQARREGKEKRFWQLAFGKRPADELYDVSKDPDCITNLADDPKYFEIRQKLRRQMESELKAQGDPRLFGKGYIFDQYQYANPELRNFYERFMRGEKLKTNWVNESDFEKEAIKDE
jgi:N-sulfoglucosamine sulfohydrolase